MSSHHRGSSRGVWPCPAWGWRAGQRLLRFYRWLWPFGSVRGSHEADEEALLPPIFLWICLSVRGVSGYLCRVTQGAVMLQVGYECKGYASRAVDRPTEEQICVVWGKIQKGRGEECCCSNLSGPPVSMSRGTRRPNPKRCGLGCSSGRKSDKHRGLGVMGLQRSFQRSSHASCPCRPC